MAQLDITELLTDPDFVDEVIQIKRKSRVDSYGKNVIDEIQVPTVGSVQPSEAEVIERIPEALRVSDFQSFWIQGEIIASERGKYTDILVFKGKRFQVVHVFDWTSWGEGWSEGLCVFEEPAA